MGRRGSICLRGTAKAASLKNNWKGWDERKHCLLGDRGEGGEGVSVPGFFIFDFWGVSSVLSYWFLCIGECHLMLWLGY